MGCISLPETMRPVSNNDLADLPFHKHSCIRTHIRTHTAVAERCWLVDRKLRKVMDIHTKSMLSIIQRLYKQIIKSVDNTLLFHNERKV